MGAEAELVYSMLGEGIWTSLFGNQKMEVSDALPTQVHTVLAYQARLAAGRLMKGAKGEGKGKQDNGNY